LGLFRINRSISIRIHPGDELRGIESPTTESATTKSTAKTTSTTPTAAIATATSFSAPVSTAITAPHDHHRRPTPSERHPRRLGLHLLRNAMAKGSGENYPKNPTIGS
jgi:hypothetical protein